MEAVSAASMANSLYPSLMKGKAEPHRQLQMTAKATAKAGVPNRVSSRAVRGAALLGCGTGLASLSQWMRLPAGTLSG